MDRVDIENILATQKDYAKSKALMDVRYRKVLLKRLYNNIVKYKDDIAGALYKDLNKSKSESYMTEIGVSLNEIRYMLKNLSKLAKVKKVVTPFSHFPSKSFIVPSPYGCVLIISPWNYPFLLSIQPLIDAIASGNSVIIKPSEYSENTTMVLESIIKDTFTIGEVALVVGGVEESTILLEQDFDYIFYTGSTRVGKIVASKALERFIPVTLELGGKSPVVVDSTADMDITARRIVFGKLLNAGQTCIAPDYIYCEKSKVDSLINALIREINVQYGADVINNDEYPKIINRQQFDRLLGLVDKDKVVFGGNSNDKLLKIEPTIVRASFVDKVMSEEIFGPILPIVTFETLEEAVNNINTYTRDSLAMYIFSNSKVNQKYIIDSCSFGGGCINDTIMYIANHNLAFGGIKSSGVGVYHGKFGFDTFTHYKNMERASTYIDMPMRYKPTTKAKDKLINMFLK